MSTLKIGSEEITSQLPASIQLFANFERFHLHFLHGLQDTSLDPSFDTRYFPQNCGAIALSCYWVRRNHLYAYGGQNGDVRELCIARGDELLFPIHPAETSRYATFLDAVGARDAASEGLRMWALPTSSIRTLLAWPDGAPEEAIFVKTSLHSRISGDRRITRRKAACSVGLSELVRCSQSDLPKSLRYFPESTAVVPRSQTDSGVIFRSLPQEMKDGSTVVAPLFSLLGGSGNYQPLFLTLIERGSLSPRELVEEVFCSRFAKLWVQLALLHGLILESHGQDLLIGLSPDLARLKCFFYRDFEGLNVDWGLRQKRRLPQPAALPHAWSWYETYGTWGYRYFQMCWCKLETSLRQYINGVLIELEILLSRWQKQGLMDGRDLGPDAVTLMFSEHLQRALSEIAGDYCKVQSNVRYNVRSFILSVMKVRQKILKDEIVTP